MIEDVAQDAMDVFTVDDVVVVENQHNRFRQCAQGIDEIDQRNRTILAHSRLQQIDEPRAKVGLHRPNCGNEVGQEAPGIVVARVES